MKGRRCNNFNEQHFQQGNRLSLDGKVNYGRINSVYEAIGLEAGVTVGQVDCAIRNVIRKTAEPVSNKEFLVRAVDTLTWAENADAAISMPSRSG